jgi:enediyne polyketide synthase
MPLSTPFNLVTCDAEAEVGRSASLWYHLLGTDRWELAQLISRETGEDINRAATRAWIASECLTKAGIARGAPLVLQGSTRGFEILLASGPLMIATFVLPDRNGQGPLVLGLLTRHHDASL